MQKSTVVLKRRFLKLPQGGSIKLQKHDKIKPIIDAPTGRLTYEILTDEELLDIIRHCNRQRRVPPFPQMLNYIALSYVTERFGTWENVIVRAGLTKEILQSKPRPKPTTVQQGIITPEVKIENAI